AEFLDPVERSNPKLVFSGFGKRDGGSGIVDRFTQAVRQQIGRAHDADELGVEFPTSAIVERLGFDEYLIRRREDREEESEKSYREFHAVNIPKGCGKIHLGICPCIRVGSLCPKFNARTS